CATGLPLSGKTNGGVENENNQNRNRLSGVTCRPRDNGSDCEQGNHNAGELIEKNTPGRTGLNLLKRIATVTKLSLVYLCRRESDFRIDLEYERDIVRFERVPMCLVQSRRRHG